MPRTRVVIYRESDGSVPLLEWLDGLPPKAVAKCRVRIERLAELGHELRRPEADLLRDGVYELRVGLEGRNFRMLYFFHGRTAVVLSHGLTKERVVPPKEIDLAVTRRRSFTANPTLHTHEEI
ncbi:MAG: type II toxin-antitoxin system RelE/ParE family toxin [Phycisphaerales bacterium]|nr:type II toxin-antitoxin system RelE/ParE family toxin [Phycisphaerales bacterium]